MAMHILILVRKKKAVGKCIANKDRVGQTAKELKLGTSLPVLGRMGLLSFSSGTKTSNILHPRVAPAPHGSYQRSPVLSCHTCEYIADWYVRTHMHAHCSLLMLLYNLYYICIFHALITKCRCMHKLLSGGGLNSGVKKWAQYYWSTNLTHESRLWSMEYKFDIDKD